MPLDLSYHNREVNEFTGGIPQNSLWKTRRRGLDSFGCLVRWNISEVVEDVGVTHKRVRTRTRFFLSISFLSNSDSSREDDRIQASR